MAGHSSKLHLVVDACGNPIYVELTSEQVHDSKVVNTFDFKHCAVSVIPVKSNSKSNNDTLD